MADRVFQLRVENTKPGATVSVGLTHPPSADEVSVGRSSANLFQLQDATVSSRHLKVVLEPQGAFTVCNLSRNGTTAVDGVRLDYGDTRTVEREHLFVQVGRVLLSVTLLPETVPVEELFVVPSSPLPDPILSGQAPLLFMRCYGQQIDLLCCGHTVSLYPSAARLLMRLCATPGQVVAHTELAAAVDPEFFERAGGTNVAQLVTYIRSMFDQALDDGHVSEARLRGALDLPGQEGLDGVPRRELLRRLVE
ncbi:MAG: FHA domain-containing protein, partial [Myxococcota bacterium]